MFIVDSDRSNVVNMDNVIHFGIEGKQIVAVTNIGDIILGRYHEEHRARKVYTDMLKMAFPPSTWIFKDCTIGSEEYKRFNDMTDNVFCVSGPDARVERYDGGVYYMPEE